MPRKSSKKAATWCDACDIEKCCFNDNISFARLHYPSPCHPRIAAGTSDCDACSALSVVESQIRQMVSDLKKLLNKHQSMKIDLNREHSPIIHKLPPEIISDIFIHCVPEDIKNDLGRNYGRADVFMPFILGAVSQTWRQIAWATPQLWTHLSISHLHSKFKLHAEHELVGQWVARSKRLPLAIYFGVRETGYHSLSQKDGRPSKNYLPLLNTIAQCSDRWQDMYLNLPFHFLSYLLGRSIALPNIRVLDLRTPVPLIDNSQHILFKHSIPAPRHVLLRWLTPWQLNIAWGSMGHVDLDRLDANKCLDLMRLTPLLESCNLSNISNYSAAPPYSNPIITLEHLTRLNIQSHTFSILAVYLSALSLPNLAHLTASIFGTGSESYRLSSLVQFLERLSNLQDLSLDIPTLPYGFRTLKEIFQAAPSVTHLLITEHRNRDDELPKDTQPIMLNPFLRHLAETSHSDSESDDCSPTSAPLFPQLESLELSLYYSFTWETFVPEILGSVSTVDSNSNRPRRPLRSLRILDTYRGIDSNDSQYIPKNILLRVLDQQAHGIEISYNHFGGPDLIAASRRFHGI